MLAEHQLSLSYSYKGWVLVTRDSKLCIWEGFEVTAAKVANELCRLAFIAVDRASFAICCLFQIVKG